MKDLSSASPPVSSYLSHAVWRGNLQAVREWLRKQQRLEQEAGGRTPVLWALSRGHKDITDFLISQGADIHKKTAEGDNALICAVWGGNAMLVQMLLDKGFNVNEKGSDGKTALSWARESDCPAVLQAIVKEAARTRMAANQQLLQEGARRMPKLRPGL
jgi:ankyrin repeat protein